jgi:hypothetical protein
MTIPLVGGGAMALPQARDRTGWCCSTGPLVELLPPTVGFAKLKSELDALGVTVFAARSIRKRSQDRAVTDEINFPLGYGVTRRRRDQLGLLVGGQAADHPALGVHPQRRIQGDRRELQRQQLGRIEAADVVRLVNFYEAQKK